MTSVRCPQCVVTLVTDAKEAGGVVPALCGLWLLPVCQRDSVSLIVEMDNEEGCRGYTEVVF